MEAVIPFNTFCKLHRGQSLEAFVANVQKPYLYIETLARETEGDSPGFATVRNVSFKDVLATDEAKLLPVEKREEANAFGMMITLGRAPNNDLVIPDQRISKFHAYFRRNADDTWTISDASSRNGTSLNGVAIEPQTSKPLESGASITLSDDLELVFLEPKDLYAMMQRG